MLANKRRNLWLSLALVLTVVLAGAVTLDAIQDGSEATGVTVTFDANGGTGLSTTTKVVEVGSEYGVLPTATKDGFGLIGWFTAASEGDQVRATDTVPDIGSQTLYAHWGRQFTFQEVTYVVIDEDMMTAKVVSSAPTISGNVAEGYEFIEGYSIIEIAPNAFKDRAKIDTVYYPFADIIGESAFENCSALSSATMDIMNGEQIMIGDRAFYNCTSLSSFGGLAVKSIGNSAFAYTVVGEFTFSDTTHIGDRAFYRNTGLYRLTGIHCNIGTEAFAGCVKIGTLNASFITGNIAIGDGAFKGCTLLKTINVPSSSALSIGNNAFEDCTALSTVRFNSIGSIGSNAFHNCFALTGITNVNNITSIGDNAFSECSSLIRTATSGNDGIFNIGAKVSSVGSNAFYNCTNINSFVVDPSNAKYISDDGILYSKTGAVTDTLVMCPQGKTGSVSVLGGVTTIEKDAFYYSKVSGITMPATVTKIQFNDDRSPFYRSYNLTSISLTGGDNGKYVTENGALYTHEYGKLLVCPSGLEGTTMQFKGDDYPNCFRVNSNTVELAPYAFESSKLVNVILGSQVTSISNTTFNGASRLQNILIEDGNPKYASENGLLFEITNTDDLTVLSAAGGRNKIEIPAKVGARRVVSISPRAFYNTAIGEVTFGLDEGNSYITTIGESAFSWCENLKSISLPDSVTTIKGYAFYRCTSPEMNNIRLGPNVSFIGDNAFAWCTNLRSFTVDPANQTYVAYKNALYSGVYDSGSGKVTPKVLIVCPAGVSSITLSDTIQEISQNAFFNCENITSITLPKSLTTIGQSAFRYCHNLTTITLEVGTDLTSIGSNAFALGEYDSTTHVNVRCHVQGADEGAFDRYTDIYTTFTYTHVVYYNTEDGDTGDVPAPVFKKTGDQITLDDTFSGTKEGYDFIGWYITEDGQRTNYIIYDPETLQPTGNSLIVVISGKNTEVCAYWSPYKYKIRFNPNEGTGTMDLEDFTFDRYVGTQKALTTNTFTRTGYTFLGWSTDPSAEVASYTDGYVNPGNWTSVKNKIVDLYAIWEANQYTVTFNGNKPAVTEGTPVVPGNISVTYDGKYVGLTDATLTGYIFQGWYTEAVDGNHITVTTDVKITDTQTLYAHWLPITYTIGFNDNGKTGGDNVPSISATYDVTYTAPACTWTKTGYTFQNWKIDETVYAPGASIKNLTATQGTTITLVAQWSPNHYTVSFNSNGGTAPSPASKDVTYDAAYGALATTSRTGYTFQGWYTGQNDGVLVESGDTVKITENQTLYAHWTANTYRVTFNAEGGSAPSPASKNVTYDAKYGTLATTSRTGYTFQGWFTSEGVEILATNDVKITDALELHAHWNPITYTVTFDGNDQGTSHAVVTTTSKGVVFDTAYGELSAVTMTGYTFQGWFTAASGGTQVTAETVLTTPASDHTLYAHWTADSHTVTFDGNTGGEPSPTSKPVTYDSPYGDLATVVKTGYTFLGWFTDAESGTLVTKNTNVKITENQTLYAHWQANSYSVVFHGNNSTEGSMSNEGFIYDKPSKALTTNAFSRTGYTFSKWNTKADGTGIDYANEQSVRNLTSAPGGTYDLYAIWQANSYSVVFHGNNSTGGSMSNEGFVYDAPSKALTANAFSRTGYTFVKWNTAADGSGTNFTNEQSVQNLTSAPGGTYDLYAIWSANTYTLTFHGNEPSTTEGHASVPGQKNVVYDALYGTLTDSVLVGYTFDGWFTAAVGGSQIEASGTVDVASNQDLYAHWTVKTFDITFNGNKPGSSTPVVPGVKNVTYDANYGEFTDATTDGYTFLGWFTAAEEGTKVLSTDRVLITTDITLYAHWSVNTYTVTFNGNDQGTSHAVVATASIDVVFDTAYGELSAVTMTGYTFQGWYTAASGGTQVTAETILTTPASDHTLYAHWTANRYIVSFDNNGSDHSPSFLSMEVIYDQQYGAMPTNLRTSYTLIGWFTDAESGTQVISTDRVLITANQVLYAHWNLKAKHTITVTDAALPNHPEAVIPTYEDLVEDGTLVLPVWNYTQGPGGTGNPFIGWKCNDGVTYPAGSTFIMGTVDATFQAWYDGEGYLSLTYHSNYATLTEKTYVMKVQSGVNLPAANGGTTFTDKTGYKFIGWAETTDGAVKYVSGQKFDMPGTDYDLYAKWEPIKYKVMYMTTNGVGTTAQQENLVYDQEYTALQNPFTLVGYENIAGWALTENLVNDTSARKVTDGGTFSNLIAVDGATVYLYPIWIPNTYSIIFDGNGADPSPAGPATINATYAVSYCVPGNTFAREGYDTFVRWNTQADGNGVSFYPCQCPNHSECGDESDTLCYTHMCTCCLYNLVTENGGSITLYAIWSINHYNVVFNTNGGTPVPESKVIAHGEKVPAPATTARDGFVFKAWFMDSGLTQPFRFSTDIVKDFEGHRLTNNQTLTLYAAWYTLVTVPTARDDLTYNNTEQMGVVPALGAVYTITGNTGTNATSATNTYSATVSLTQAQLATYMWNVPSVVSTWAAYYADYQAGADWDISQGTVAQQSIPWSIAKKTLAGSMLALSGTYTYNGKEQTVTHTVTDSDASIVPADYTVSGHKRTNQGTQAIVITATDGNYTGSISKDWTVLKRDLSNATLTLSGSYTYSGQNQNVAWSVTDIVDGDDILKSTDYTITGLTHCNHGTYTFTVTATDAGNYKNSIHDDWTIGQKTLTQSMLVMTQVAGGYVYDGTDQTVQFTVTDGTALVAADYTATGKTHRDHGTYTLTITANPEGNYTGSISDTWTIQQRHLSSITLTVTSEHTYDGTEQTVLFTATEGSPSIVVPGDYTVSGNTRTNQGTQDLVLTATPTGNYTGSTSVPWTIAKKALSESMFSFTKDPHSYVYSGVPQNVAFTMTDGTALVAADYSVSDNIRTVKGTQNVVITATPGGNYSGSFSKEWEILPAQLSLSQNESFTYNAGTTWNVTAAGVNGESKTVTLTLSATGIGVYASSGTKTFTATSDTETNTNYVEDVIIGGHTVTITKKALTDAMLTLSGEYTYSGSDQTVSHTMTDATALIVAADYTVSGHIQRNQGIYDITVTATPEGNYSGSIVKQWTIAKKALTDAMLTLSPPVGGYIFDGQDRTVDYEVADGGALVSTDYTISGHIQRDHGTYDVTVTATPGGNYSGSIVKQWTIGQRTLTASMLTLSGEYTYTGLPLTVSHKVTDIIGENPSIIIPADYELSGLTATNKGTYTVTLTAKNTGNYTGSVSKDWEILPAQLNLYRNETFEFNNGNTWNIIAAGVNGETKQVTVTLSATSVGTYAATGERTFTATSDTEVNTNYVAEVLLAGHTATIAKKALTDSMLALSGTYTYNGQNQTVDYTVTDAAALIVSGDYTVSGHIQRNQGTYDITITATDAGNYDGEIVKQWTINKRSLTDAMLILSPPLTGYVYNGQNQTVDYEVSDGAIEITTDDYDITGHIQRNQGTYDITVTATDAGNYDGEIVKQWTIAKKALTQSMLALSGTYTYNGAQQTVTNSVTDGDPSILVAGDYTMTGHQQKEAGTYTVTVTATDGGNYSGSISDTWTIQKMTLTVPAMTDRSKTYDGISSFDEIVQGVAGVQPGDSVIVLASVTFDKNVGQNRMTITYTLSGTGYTNYNDVTDDTSVPKFMTISKAHIVVSGTTAADKVYDGTTDATPTIGTTVVGIIAADVGKVTPVITGSAFVTKVVGSRVVTIEYGLVGEEKDNYDVSGNNPQANITVKSLHIFDVAIANKMYDGLPLASVAVLYDEEDVVEGDAVSIIATGIFSDVNAGDDKPVEVYYTLSGLDSVNYVVDSSAVGPKSATIVPVVLQLPDRQIVYDSVTDHLSFDLPGVHQEIISAIYTASSADAGVYTYSTTPGAGLYTVELHFGALSTGNYTVPDDFEATFTILQKTLTISSAVENKVFDGTTDATANINVSGIETSDVGKVVVTPTATFSDMNVGTDKVVAITFAVSGDRGANYVAEATFSVADITPKDVSSGITFALVGATPVYDGTIHTMTVTATFTAHPEVQVTYFLTNNIAMESGDYVLVVNGTGNFTGTKNVDWSIGKRNLANAVLAVTGSYVYNGGVQNVSFTVTDLIGGSNWITSSDYTATGNTGTNVGDYTLVVTATDDGNYYGELRTGWSIAAKDISSASFRNVSTLTYNGEEQTVTYDVYDGVTLLAKGTHYSVSAQSDKATDADTHTLVIAGTGNYTGTTSVDWSILPKMIVSSMIDVTGSRIYSGAAQTVTYDVKDGSLDLVKGTDFTASGDVQTHAGSYILTLVGTGNYTGTAVAPWSIAKKALSDSMVTVSGTYTYSGAAQTVTYAVSDGTAMVPADYIVSGQTHTDYGTYELVITASPDGNYMGIAKASWSIARLNIADATVILGGPLTYNGQKQTMTVTVDVGDLPATVDIIGNSETDAGDYTLTIVGYGNFTGSITRDWSIARLNIADATITLDDELTYNGKRQTMPATVTISGLTATVTLAGNAQTDAGDYTLTATGTGNYTGTASRGWSIARLGIEHSTVIYESDLIYTGQELTRTATVMVNGLVADVEYDGNKATNAGSYTMRISGVGNYSGHLDKAWTISKKAFNESLVNVTTTSLLYNGLEQRLQYTVTDGDPSAITESDYIVNSGDRGTQIGDYCLVLMATDDGNYSGNAIINWRIIPSGVVVTLDTAGGSFSAVGWTNIGGDLYTKGFNNDTLWGAVLADIGDVTRYGYTFAGYLPEVDVDAQVGLDGGSIVAQWTNNDYVVTIIQPAHGTVTVTGHEIVEGHVTVPYLTDLVLQYNGADGYYLTSWIGAEQDGHLTVLADCEVACTIDDMYHVVFDANGTVTDTVQEYGKVITLIARPDNFAVGETRYIYCGWDGYLEGMTVMGDMRFTAWYSVVYSDTTKTANIDKEGVLVLDEKSIDDIIDSDDEYIRIHGTDASVLMRMSTFESISDSGEFTLVMEANRGGFTPEQEKVVGDKYALTIEAWNGAAKVHQLGKDVFVTVPFQLTEGLSADNIMIYYVQDNGQIVRCRDAYYDSEQEAMCFTTDHFSVFMIDVDHSVISIPATVLAVLFGVLVVAVVYTYFWYTRRGY